MRSRFVLAMMVASVGFASLAASENAEALTTGSLHCPALLNARLEIVNDGGKLEIRGTATAPESWSGGGVGARVVDRRALRAGSHEEQVTLPPHVAWVRGSQLVCGYRLVTAGYRVDAELTARCPAGSGGCVVPGDGRAPGNFRFDQAR